MPRLTRRAVILTSVAAGLGAVSVRSGLWSRARRQGQAVVDFGRIADRRTWGPMWHLQHYRRTLVVAGGEGVLELPPGLATTAPDQPAPIFLLDHACRNCVIELDFSVDNPTARPGVILGATSSFEYATVTVEGERVVLARNGRAGRTVIATGRAAALRAGAAYRLRVHLDGARVRATLGRPSGAAERPLDATMPDAPLGTPGVVLVHPTDLGRAVLRVRRFTIATPEPFVSTAPVATYLLSGIPAERPGAPGTVLLRAGSAYPARVRFEWALDADWSSGSGASGWLSAEEPPYTAVHAGPAPTDRPLHWRARLRSVTSGAETVTDTHIVTPHDADRPLVMLAVSCIEFWGMPPTYGFTRMPAAGAAPPSALVFQGDMGYANNRYHSCYVAEEDYFADRFTRFLADPQFVSFRRKTPVGFTMDDHDYGPRNNADRTTLKPWTIPLWNRMHADPSTDGYFDFRIGDVHCMTLDGRRYADPIWYPNRPGKTKLGARQFAWMQSTLENSDAELFVLFSADTFASRFLRPDSRVIPDCFISGWPDEYDRAMTLFGRIQAEGRRVVILSGDAHSLRIHYHPVSGHRSAAAAAIVEFVCSGLRPRRWSGAATGDPTLDPIRNVLGRAGGGMLTVDPAAHAARTVVLRAISGERSGPIDLFPPLVLPFRPTGPPAPAAGA